MVYLDRFVIGAVISVTAVAYYATPYEIVTKIGIIPALYCFIVSGLCGYINAIQAVLFNFFQKVLQQCLFSFSR